MDFTSYQPLDTVELEVTSAPLQTPQITPSGIINGNRIVVRMLASVPTCVEIGDSPEATLHSMEMVPGWPEWFDMRAGQRVSAIRARSANADGFLKVTALIKRRG